MAEQFSPTGYWAHYCDGDGTYNYPVIGTKADSDGELRPLIIDTCGTVKFVADIDDLEFLGVFTSPSGE